jgi:hypothetical protein
LGEIQYFYPIYLIFLERYIIFESAEPLSSVDISFLEAVMALKPKKVVTPVIPVIRRPKGGKTPSIGKKKQPPRSNNVYRVR